MQKLHTLSKLLANPVVAIVRSSTAQIALDVAEACLQGGITAIEVSLTTPDGLEVIRTLAGRHGDRVLVGAGTVLDAATARLAVLAGARFILSPSLDLDVIRACNRYQVVSMPGVATPTEAVQAMEAGADIIKVFPAEIHGPGYLRALRAPLPQMPLMPSGGVTLENAAAWFAAGAVAVGVGGSLTGPAGECDLAAVAGRAARFVAACRPVAASLQEA